MGKNRLYWLSRTRRIAGAEWWGDMSKIVADEFFPHIAGYRTNFICFNVWTRHEVHREPARTVCTT